MEYFTSEPHEFINSSGVWCEELNNDELLEQAFQEDAQIFRADFFQTLSSLGAIEDGEGWAYYIRRSMNEDGSSKYVETVLKSDMYEVTVDDHVITAPVIRIIINESMLYENSVQWLTYDFMLDDTGNTQYFVDVVNQQIQNLSETQAALIMMSEDGELKINNLKSYTPVAIIGEDEAGTESIVPFGHYSHISDKIDALEVGRLFLNNIADQEPKFIVDINTGNE